MIRAATPSYLAVFRVNISARRVGRVNISARHVRVYVQVLQLHAVDCDEGSNAVVKYSVDKPSYFAVVRVNIMVIRVNISARRVNISAS